MIVYSFLPSLVSPILSHFPPYPLIRSAPKLGTSRRIYIGNLPTEFSEDDVRELACVFGRTNLVMFHRDTNPPHAVVEYALPSPPLWKNDHSFCVLSSKCVSTPVLIAITLLFIYLLFCSRSDFYRLQVS